MTNINEWINPQIVARPLDEGGYDIAEQTQSKWRIYKNFPYYKVGKFVRYKRSELDAYFEAHQIQGGVQCM